MHKILLNDFCTCVHLQITHTSHAPGEVPGEVKQRQLVMGRSRTSRLKEPALLSERWESAPQREPVSFFFSCATGATCIHSTRVTAHTWQPATDHKNKQQGARDFDA